MNDVERMKTIVIKKVQKAESRFNALSKRERGLMFLSVLIAIYVICNALTFDVFFADQKDLEQSIQEKKNKIASVKAQIEVIASALAKDPLHPLIEQIKALKQENILLQEKMVEQTKQMVSPKEMAKIVKSLVEKTQGLNIALLESVGSKPLFETSQAELIHFQVYQHELKLEMTGDYFQTLQFLESMENQTKVLWNTLDYSVEEYPKSKIKILIDTLGLEEGWIGV